MDPKRYFTYTVIGGILWAAGITALGHVLGNITFIKNNIEAIFILIVVVSVVPLVIEYARNRRERKLAAVSDAEVTQQIPRIDR
jgi:membrane-associated protein